MNTRRKVLSLLGAAPFAAVTGVATASGSDVLRTNTAIRMSDHKVVETLKIEFDTDEFDAIIERHLLEAEKRLSLVFNRKTNPGITAPA